MNPAEYNPKDLPLKNGFRFIGISDDDQEMVCEVVQDPETSTHYTVGIDYCHLIGWRHYESR